MAFSAEIVISNANRSVYTRWDSYYWTVEWNFTLFTFKWDLDDIQYLWDEREQLYCIANEKNSISPDSMFILIRIKFKSIRNGNDILPYKLWSHWKRQRKVQESYNDALGKRQIRWIFQWVHS